MWIRNLQNLEREKLQLTVILHVERKRLAQLKLLNEETTNFHLPACKKAAVCGCAKRNFLTIEEDEFAVHIQEGKVT